MYNDDNDKDGRAFFFLVDVNGPSQNLPTTTTASSRPRLIRAHEYARYDAILEVAPEMTTMWMRMRMRMRMRSIDEA